MSARDVITMSLRKAASTGESCEMKARWVSEALTEAGFRILGPDELDPVTVERCVGVVDGRNSGFRALDAERNGIASAIRSLIPAQPEAKEARTAAWPTGCHSPNSCTRHLTCMYTNCRYENLPIKAEIESALKAKEARDGR